MTQKFYAGIGSRSTPPEIMTMMQQVASRLGKRGYTLRSGGAAGADTAFESGVPAGAPKEIYLPSEGFNGNKSSLFPERLSNWDYALELAERFHPAWDRLSPFAKRLQARNCYQVLGADLCTPVQFVVCYTPDGCSSHESRSRETGGTGQAISIASFYNIPVFNLLYGDVMLKKIADLIGHR